MRMPFGKHKGTHIRDIPTSYLEWLVENVEFTDPRLGRRIREEL